MKRKINYLIILLPVLFVLLSLFVTYGYGAWVITSTNSLEPVEVTGLIDENLKDYDLLDSIVYDRSSHTPHDGLENTDFNTIYSYTAQNMIKVGTYIVKYENNITHIVTNHEFKILPNALTVEIPTTLPSYFYSTSCEIDQSLFTVTDYYGTIIDNYKLEFTCGEIDSTKEGGEQDKQAQTIHYVCSVPGNSNYEIAEGTFEITLKSVAHINDKYFSTLSSALSYSASSTDSNEKIVYAIPNLLESDGKTRHIIKVYENLSIASGVTLCMPYEGETYGIDFSNGSQSGMGSNYSLCSGKSFADRDSTNVNANRKTVINILDNITLTNNGTILIGGILGIGISNQKPSGHTVSSYTEILMNSGSKIINNGQIECNGYIKESSSNNGSQLEISNGAKFTLPYVIYDYRGGSYSSAGNNQKVLPFSAFDFPNCQIQTIIYQGGTYAGKMILNANNTFYAPEPVNVVGTSSALFLMKSSGTVTIKYTPVDCRYTTNDHTATTENNKTNDTTIQIDCDLQVSSLDLSVANVSMNTSKFFCPISYKITIIVNSGTTTITNKVKFLRGSTAIINSAATLQINASTIFYQSYAESSSITTGVVYPTAQPAARFINNGTVNINAGFAGVIETTETNAKITTTNSFASTLTSDEMITGENLGANWTYQTVTGYALGNISNTETPPTTLSSFNKSSTYVSRGTWWYGNSTSTSNRETTGASQSGSCITADTLITLADGTKKQVQDLSADDLLLVFNHETGKYEFANIIFIDIEPERIYRIVNLKFSDGTIVKVVYEHGFFDLDLNKYVYIREDNMHEFIGHKFYQADFDGINYVESEVTLVDAYVTEELTTVYSPVTVYHLNYFTEDMLSMPAGIPGLFNIFEFGDNLTYDEEQMQADIEKYGLYTYDDFKDYISYEVYMMFPAPYLKVAVGKGLTTYEDIVQMIYTYLEKHDLMKNNNS